jgi:hypothetical protein
MLLGYLLPFKIEQNSEYHNIHFPEIIDKSTNLSFREYPNDIWGAQMYAISKEYGKHLLSTYTINYAIMNPTLPYNPDWIITKKGKRALIYPMLALEEGENISNNDAQIEYHTKCYNIHYNKYQYN